MKHLTTLKRVVSVMLAVCMLIGVLSTAVFADSGARIVRARKINGLSRPVNTETQTERAADIVPLYGDDEMVTAIVQLESPAVIDYYNGGVSAFSTQGMIIGSVSEFLTSSAADVISDDLLSEQQELIDLITAISAPQSNGAIFGNEPVEVLMQYTGIINAMVIRVPYGKLDEIKKLNGVKRAYVQHTYSAPEPASDVEIGIESYSYNMVGVAGAWREGYTGTGTVVAILDTGLDLSHQAFTENSFMRANPAVDAKYNKAGIAARLEMVSDYMMAPTMLTSGSMSDTYKNLKVPYAFDYAAELGYAAGDTDVMGGDAHGTHVAGTVAGYAVTDEGAVEFSGIAPDAQLMILKVFNDQGSMTDEMMLIAALNDAIVLGADVVNLSLGSSNGFAEDDSLQPDLFRAIEEAGVTVMASAGNEGHSDYNSTGNGVGLNGYGNLTTNPEMSMIGSPAVYDSNIAVASINNVVEYASMLVVDGMGFKFSESNGAVIWSDVMGDIEDSVPIYLIDGVGTEEDYAASAFANGAEGIALVQRGEISFAEKVINAQAYDGVVGVIIYDNVAGKLIRMDFSDYEVNLPAAFISLADGSAIAKAIAAGDQLTYDGIFEGFIGWEDDDGWQGVGGEMSYFSSWGAGPGLELKPDITAPGGNILSSVFAGGYDIYSGTSMAAPHMSGLAALVAQYVGELGVKGNTASTLSEHLLVSTSHPLVDAYGSFYSPRQQGSGLADVSAAISTPAYITVDGANVGKLELGDDPSWTGAFDYSFNVVNMSANELTYEATVYYMVPDFYQLDEETYFMINADMYVGYDDPFTVTVAPNSTATVTGTIDASDLVDTIAYYFPNGTYVEGFIILEDVTEENPEISLPYLGFVGDWTEAPIFDSATWFNYIDENGNPTDAYFDAFWGISTIACPIDDQYIMVPGTNPYYGNDANLGVYYPENFTLSPNEDGYFDYIGYYDIYQLRDAKLMIMEARDKVTGEVYYHDYLTCMKKTTYSTNYQTVFPYSWYISGGWDGTDLEGNLLPSGTQVVYTVTAYGEGEYPMAYDEDYGMWYLDGDAVDPADPSTEPTFNGHAMSKIGDVISFDLLVDYAEPELKNDGEVIVESFGEDGLYIAEGTFDDGNGSIAGIEAYAAYLDDQGNIADYYPIDWVEVYDPDINEYTFNFIIDSTLYDNWEGDVLLMCVDYGANESMWIFNVYETADEELVMFVGEEDSLLAELAPYLKWTSSDESVITVDENGNIVAVGSGTAIVTGTDPETGDEITYSITVVGLESADTTKGGNTVSGDDNSVTLTVGDTDTLVIELTSSLVEVDGFVWTTSDGSIVTVDENGNITAVSEGTATVTAASASHPGLTITFTVNVVKKAATPPHSHSHVFGAWSADLSGHWRSCLRCGMMIDINGHVVDANGRCVVCGYIVGTGADNVTEDVDGEVTVNTPTQSTDNVDDESDDSDGIEVNDPVETNPHTGVAFSAFGLAIAAAAVVSTKRK